METCVYDFAATIFRYNNFCFSLSRTNARTHLMVCWFSAVTLLLIESSSPSSPSSSNLTFNVFSDVISVVSSGLTSLGYAPSLLRCPFLSRGPCSKSALLSLSTPIVVIAPHNLLSVVVTLPGGGEEPLILHDPTLLPEGTVLYNFEVVPESYVGVGVDGATATTTTTTTTPNSFFAGLPDDPRGSLLRIYALRRFVVWDYCEGNVRKLNGMGGGVGAQLVPMGFGPGLLHSNGDFHGDVNANAYAESGVEDIDVLFFGTLTPHRKLVIRSLRSSGLRVVVPNSSNWGSYGRGLDLLVRRARVVLSLKTFGEDAEWKITRLARLLANGKLVVAERGGNTEEQAFEEGVVFAEGVEGVLREVKWWVGEEMEEERRRRAEEGQKIIMRQDEKEFLREPMERLMKMYNES